MTIPVFDDINASHEATGYHGRTDLPDFHIFSIEDTYPTTRQAMPPYRFNFYQIVLFENARDASLDVNAERASELSDHLFFASPEHVLAWTRGEALRGYILYFTDAFLAHYPRPVIDAFPFFRLTEINSLQVTTADHTTLHDHFGRLLQLFLSEHPYRAPMLQAYLLALLFDCKRLYDAHQAQQQHLSPQVALTFRFQQFVNQHFVVRKKVADYADLLGVTPDYLGQVIRTTTQKTPLTLITERVVLEAKKLLRYSDMPISEIADCLGYDEPTHFGRMFRRHTGTSPSAWRGTQQ